MDKSRRGPDRETARYLIWFAYNTRAGRRQREMVTSLAITAAREGLSDFERSQLEQLQKWDAELDRTYNWAWVIGSIAVLVGWIMLDVFG